MSNTSAPPSLEDYPGFFPAAKPPFWSRTKVGAASGLIGLLLGVLVGSVADSDPAKPKDLSATVESLEQQLDDAEGALSQQAEDSEAALEAAEAELAQAKQDAKVAKRKAKALAKADPREEASETTPDIGAFSEGPLRKADPRFADCAEVTAAGYGPYLRGIDAEYGWYTDPDNDGLACES